MSDEDRTNEEWIRTKLVPMLLNGGKLNDGQLIATTVKSIEIARLSMAEAFMLTLCFKVVVTVTDRNQPEDRKVGIVIKTTPDIDADVYDRIGFGILFENEVIAYEKILQSLRWTDSYPKYFYSNIQPNKATVALGDFTFDGYRMSKSMVNLSLEHILRAVYILGQFHGKAYALKHTSPERFHEIRKQFKESRFHVETTDPQWDRRLRIGPKRAAQAVRSNAAASKKVPESFLARIESIMNDCFAYQRNMVQPHEPMAILCHGDFLRNNIAFKYDTNDDDTPTDAMMFDFQTLRYSSPMGDLASFMANSTGVDVRAANFDQIFKCYHDSLVENFCKATGMTPTAIPDFLSYASFLKEFARYMPYGLSIAGSFVQCLHEPSTEMVWNQVPVEAEEIKDAYERGGEIVDRELRALVTEMYEMYEGLKLDL